MSHINQLQIKVKSLAGGVVYGGLEQIKANQQRAIMGGGILSGVNPAVGIGTTAFALGEFNYLDVSCSLT